GRCPPWRIPRGRAEAMPIPARSGFFGPSLPYPLIPSDEFSPGLRPGPASAADSARPQSVRGSCYPLAHRRQARSILKSDWQDFGPFHLTERKARLDRCNVFQSGQLVLDEPLICFEIRSHDPHQIIARTGHQVAIDHFRPARHRLLEAIEIFLALPFQLDRGKGIDWQADLLLV